MKDFPMPCIDYIIFLYISMLFVQKLANAMAANPISRMDFNPPIILNNSSNSVLPALQHPYAGLFIRFSAAAPDCLDLPLLLVCFESIHSLNDW